MVKIKKQTATTKPKKLLCVLERYYENGYLDFKTTRRYTALSRCSYGMRLAADFQIGGHGKVIATDCSKIRVDGGTQRKETDRQLYHQQRYNRAMASVPKEFRAVIRHVCIEDKPIADNDNELILSARRRAEWNFSGKIDLCRGLDRLIDFYDSYEHPDDEPA